MIVFGNRICTPEQVRHIDRVAIGTLGIPGYTLMTRAAAAVVEAACSTYPVRRAWTIFCGAGNNGGDGYVIGRLARDAGLSVRLVAVTDPSQLSGDAARARDDFRAAGGGIETLSPAAAYGAQLIVDAVFGTGLTRAVEGPARQAIELMNGAGCPVVAVDVPSGLDALTGRVMGVAVRAQLTVTFIARKLGLYIGAGPDLTGRIVYAALDVPAGQISDVAEVARLFDATDVAALLPRRRRTAHKGDFGHVLIVGGNRGMAGAARLAGEAALRAGAGLVTVATRPGNEPAITGPRPELMCRGVESATDIEPLLARATLIAVGPGLGQDDWARGLLAGVLATPVPLVVDADAVNLVAQAPQRRTNWVLTPHPGEAARLLGTDTQTIQADRPAAVRRLVERYGGTALLKGRCTLIAAAEAPLQIIDGGNPGMASGGMGDVLTGIIAGLLAQFPQQSPQLIAAAGAWVHAAAADSAASGGERGLLAGDVLEHLRAWLNPSR